ncbi:MAG: rhodanese-like domain-containing protein [Halofilum sp. (in: g-proteobacteria)]|nr:rhodanese-like domain-containing protein [Halofilum sp. (in: g-proteobacteria)]
MKRIPLIGVLVVVAALPVTAHARELAPLVSVDWLASQSRADDLVVLDIRSAIDDSDRETFEQGHIPGAVYSSYTDDGWRREENGVPGKLPPVAELERLIGGLGIGNDDDVVIVPAGVGSTDFGAATRVYWTFKVLGHDDVAILQRRPPCVGRGRPRARARLERARQRPLRGGLPPRAAGHHSRRSSRAREAGVQLVDNRPAAQFRGAEKHPEARASGTIPGALNLQQGELVRAGTAFVIDPARLDALMEQVGVRGDERTITFCNTGHWASIGWFVLSEVRGQENVAMYDGSMTAWSQDPGRPLQTARSGIGAVLDWLFN